MEGTIEDQRLVFKWDGSSGQKSMLVIRPGVDLNTIVAEFRNANRELVKAVLTKVSMR